MKNINIIYFIKIIDPDKISGNLLTRAFYGGHTQNLKYKLLKSDDSLNIFVDLNYRIGGYDNKNSWHTHIEKRMFDIKNNKRLE